MTRVLGINYARGRSSVLSTNNNRILEGRVLNDSTFPSSTVRELKTVHDDWDYAVCHVPELFEEFKSLVKPITSAKPILVDYREALAMSSIAMYNWTSCAVMVIDSFCCSLGYYANNQFYWLREFTYPNSIALFYSAATRFLGYDPLTEEHKLMEVSQHGNPTYANLIENKFINTVEGDYTLLQDITRGIGQGPLNVDIAASVQAIFDKTIVHLALWLNKAVGSKCLAYAGRVSANYLTNTKIANLTSFNEILIQPLTSYAGAVVGATSLVSRSIFSSTDLGEEVISSITPDILAKQLINGNIIKYINGKEEFINSSLINRNWLAIPFNTIFDKFKNHGKLNNFQQPLILCQERDYLTYYQNSIIPKYGQYSSNSLVNVLPSINNTNKVVAINSASNPYLYRVLEILRTEGYPLLLSTPII